MDYHRILDASATLSPWPLLNCKKALAGMAGGRVLKVIVHPEDEDANMAIETFCKQTGHEFIGHSNEQGFRVCYVKSRTPQG